MSDWGSKEYPFQATTKIESRISHHRPYLDLSTSFRPCSETNYSAVILLAGKTSTQWCEDHPKESAMINVDNTIQIARFFAEQGSHVLFLSSTQVFDGSHADYKPSDPVSPKTEYGRQKVRVEKAILEFPISTILRIPKISHPTNRLLNEWKNNLTQGRPIFPLSNVYLSLVTIEAVIDSINEILNKQITGIRHLSGGPEFSYTDYAKSYCLSLGVSTTLVVPRPIGAETVIHRHSSLAE
jgi:dTDP-4-dehydrorhamnose reductase